MHQISETEALDQLDWWYNWGPNADSVAMHRSAELGIEFVPMQWGKWGIETLSKDIQPEAKHLLGFNEPGHQEQSDLQPEEAAALWPSMQAVAHDMGLKLGTPSPAPCGAQCVRASPFQWCVHAYTDCLSRNNQLSQVHHAASWLLLTVLNQHTRHSHLCQIGHILWREHISAHLPIPV